MWKRYGIDLGLNVVQFLDIFSLKFLEGAKKMSKGMYIDYRPMDSQGRFRLTGDAFRKATEVAVFIERAEGAGGVMTRSIMLTAARSEKILGVDRKYLQMMKVDDKGRVTIPKSFRLWLVGAEVRPVWLLVSMPRPDTIELVAPDGLLVTEEEKDEKEEEKDEKANAVNVA